MNAWHSVLPVLIGAVSGVLSGAFGIGGGIVTTPAIRLLLQAPALIAVGTPLPVIVPGALAGAASYARRGLADIRAGLVIGVVGALGAILGAYASDAAGGTAVMLATAALIAFVAADMVVWTARGAGTAGDRSSSVPARPRAERLAAVGLAAGLYSGFLGLGGGFIIVPLLVRWLRFSAKRAAGTSLVAVAIVAVPGSVAHYALGHIDLRIAAGLALGVIPGVLVGARLTAAARERTVRFAFAAMLMATAVWLAVGEVISR